MIKKRIINGELTKTWQKRALDYENTLTVKLIKIMRLPLVNIVNQEITLIFQIYTLQNIEHSYKI